MEKRFYLMNSPELPTPGTHFYCTSKFMSGFTYYGYQTAVANTLDDITDHSIVLLSDHGSVNHSFFKNLEYLAAKFPNCIYICWFYHDYYERVPFKYFVITGEHFRKKPEASHFEHWELQQRISNYIPLTFSSNMVPEQVGTLPRPNPSLRDGCFIGTPYKPEWVYNLPNIAYITGNNLPEQDRINIFLSSKIAFGFHMSCNIDNHVIVERVFEAMAFGCPVISDSPDAGELTGGIVQVAHNHQEFLEIYHRLLNNDAEREELRQRGYEWVKQYGLYVHTAKNFLDGFAKLWPGVF